MTHSLYCTGRGSRLCIGNASGLGLSEASFTVTAWINIVRHNPYEQGDNCIIGSNDTNEFRCIHLLVRNGHPYMGFYCNDTSSNELLTVDTWYHLAFVYNLTESTQSIFINGQLSKSEGGHGPLQGNAEVFVSEYAASRGLNGRLSQLQIHNRALNEKEIKLLMFKPSPFFITRVTAEGKQDLTTSTIARQIAVDKSVPVYSNLDFTKSSVELSFADNFIDFYNNPIFSDVIIKIPHTATTDGGLSATTTEDSIKYASYYAHKIALVSRSEYFKMMFSSGMVESTSKEVVLSELDPDLFGVFLRSLYSKDLNAVKGILEAEGIEEWAIIMALTDYAMRFQVNELLRWFEICIIDQLLRQAEGADSIDDNDILKAEIERLADERGLSTLSLFLKERVKFFKEFTKKESS